MQRWTTYNSTCVQTIRLNNASDKYPNNRQTNKLESSTPIDYKHTQTRESITLPTLIRFRPNSSITAPITILGGIYTLIGD